MDAFLTAVTTVLPLFFVILTGAFFSRTKTASPDWVEILNKYALYIGFPALVVASMMHLELQGQSYLKLLAYTSGYIVFCMLLAFPIARIFRLSKNMLRSLFLILPFGNIAYLGMPILQNAFGDEILPVAAVISSIYVFWLFTLGIVLIEVYGEEKLQTKKLFLNLLQNPLLISVLIGLFLVIFQINLPDFVAKTIQLFADSVTAVVLFSLGIFLGMQKIGDVGLWFRVIALTVFTMLVLPFVFFHVLNFANFDPLLTEISVIDSAMPLGLTPYALTVVYKLESNLAARIVVFGTLLSVLVVPLWMVWLA